jgi:2-dehydro-3-deoxyphosphogluconate aldolase/(4S)-4-hydroxy-2-oxoglutarate aldolase
MTRAQVRQRIIDSGIIPVVRAPSAELASAASRAVAAGGIGVVEVTLTVPGAIELIAQLARSHSDILIGAGTVLDTETAQQSLDAGAQFLVSPGFDTGTVELAARQGVVMMAGALTPTEVIHAWKSGVDFVKIFPCGNVGGPSYIKALKAALPQIPMVPTGGVNLNTAAAFLEAGSSALGVGGELISAAALKSSDFEGITKLARQYLAIVHEARRISEPPRLRSGFGSLQ